MSGENTVTLDMPPGVFKERSRFATGKRWFDANFVRWFNDVLVPIGGWITYQTLVGPTQPVRTMFSWYDNSAVPWMANGSADKAILIKIATTPEQNDITPVDLAWAPGGHVGYGGGAYGSGAYSLDTPATSPTFDTEALWSFDNWGQDLLGVHSQDGRLLQWSPSDPLLDFEDVLNSPADNRIVVVSEERHAFVLGGVSNPRRVKWCSREALEDWVPTETNSAGGFELDSEGGIVAAVKIPGGIAVLTDQDVHIIEYVGAPFYYSQRLLTNITGIKGQNAKTVTPNGLIWLGASSYWKYDGAVSQLPCTIQGDVFSNSNLERPAAVFLENNELHQEVWTFYPTAEASEADKYALFSYKSNPFWSPGSMARHAMLNPVFQSRPFMAYNNVIYEHERGWTADGVSRNADVWATSGYVTLDKANHNIKCDRVWPDAVDSETFGDMDSSDPFPYTVSFTLKQAPMAVPREKGPIVLNTAKGYNTIRFRAKMVAVTVNQVLDQFWGAGHLMLRTKPGGRR